MLTPVLSVPQVAERLGIKYEGVLALIKSGELRAFNVARNRRGKLPRWRIRPEDLDAFEVSRMTSKPAIARPKSRSQKRDAGYIEYF